MIQAAIMIAAFFAGGAYYVLCRRRTSTMIAPSGSRGIVCPQPRPGLSARPGAQCLRSDDGAIPKGELA